MAVCCGDLGIWGMVDMGVGVLISVIWLLIPHFIT